MSQDAASPENDRLALEHRTNFGTDIFSLSGRVALVTGGSGDIGRCIAEFFVRRGVRTYISARNKDRCEQVARELSRHGECRAVPADIASVDDIARLAAEISAQETGLDIIVNNAGAAHYAPLAEFSEQGWDDIFDTNLKSVFFMTQAFLSLLRGAASVERPATIINIGSAAGIQVSPNEAYSYSTSKAALNYLTRKLARRLAADNITVNTVSPGPVAAGLMNLQDEGFKDSVRKVIPLGRMARADEVAAAVMFLASPAAAYITGAILPVDGGVTGCL